MEQKKSLLSKLLLTVVLPVVLVFFATAGIVLSVVSQNFDQFGDIQNSLILIFTIGLVVMVSIIVLGARGISNRINRLAEAATRLAEGDITVDLKADKTDDQLGEVADALSGIVERMMLQSEMAEKLAFGDLSAEILPSSDKDVVGNSLMTVKTSIKMINDYLIQLPELVAKEEDLYVWKLR